MRRMTPGAVFNSFLGILDLKLGKLYCIVLQADARLRDRASVRRELPPLASVTPLTHAAHQQGRRRVRADHCRRRRDVLAVCVLRVQLCDAVGVPVGAERDQARGRQEVAVRRAPVRDRPRDRVGVPLHLLLRVLVHAQARRHARAQLAGAEGHLRARPVPRRDAPARGQPRPAGAARARHLEQGEGLRSRRHRRRLPAQGESQRRAAPAAPQAPANPCSAP